MEEVYLFLISPTRAHTGAFDSYEVSNVRPIRSAGVYPAHAGDSAGMAHPGARGDSLDKGALMPFRKFAEPFVARFGRALGLAGGGGGSAVTYASYIASLAPLGWWKYTETSGSNAANSGSVGSAIDGTISGTTALGQTGQLGANEAFLFDGLTSLITVPANAAIDGLQAATYAFLINPASGGEAGGQGWLFNANSGDIIFFNSGMGIGANINGTGNAASRATDLLTVGAWAWVFVTYDYGGDKKIRIYYDTTEVTYISQTAGTGSKTANATNKTLGNRAGQDRTIDAVWDEFLIFGRVLTPSEVAQIVALSFP